MKVKKMKKEKKFVSPETRCLIVKPLELLCGSAKSNYKGILGTMEQEDGYWNI